MSNAEGWIKLYRSIQDNPIWTSEPFNRAQALVDLLLLANHKDGYIYVRDHKIRVKRGQVGWSQQRLAKRWDWSRGKVKRFLKDLENEHQVKLHESKSYTITTLINYEINQSKEEKKTSGKHQIDKSKTTDAQQEDTNKNDKNVKKYNVEEEKSWDRKSPIDFYSFVNRFNQIYSTNLRVTDSKRKQIKARLQDYSAKEIVQSWTNRFNDNWLNGSEGKKFLGDWNAAMRNSEKIEKYLNIEANSKPQLIDEGTF